MRIRSYASALVVGGLVLTGGLAAGPEESENGCRGVNEADEHNDDASQDALEMVKSIIDEEDCKDEPPASDQKGGNGDRSEG